MHTLTHTPVHIHMPVHIYILQTQLEKAVSMEGIVHLKQKTLIMKLSTGGMHSEN